MINQLSKIFVHSNNHAILRNGDADNLFIFHARVKVFDIFHVITRFPQICLDPHPHTDINEKFQFG